MDTTTEKTASVATEPTTEEMKAKYGKLYQIGTIVYEDDESEGENLTFRFKKPSIASYDRFVKTMSQIGASKASKAFMMDNVVEEDRSRLIATMEEYPGVGIALSGKLTDILGLTGTVNLKKL